MTDTPTRRAIALVQSLMLAHLSAGRNRGPQWERLSRLEAYLIDRYHRDTPPPTGYTDP